MLSDENCCAAGSGALAGAELFRLDALAAEARAPEPALSAAAATGPLDTQLDVELTSNKWNCVRQGMEIIKMCYHSCTLTATPNIFQILAGDPSRRSPDFVLDVHVNSVTSYSCHHDVSVIASTHQLSCILKGSVKKKEPVTFFIDAHHHRSGIFVNTTSNHAKRSDTPVSTARLHVFEEPDCFAAAAARRERPFVVPISLVGNMLKDLRNVAKTVTVSCRPGEWIRFQASSLHSRSIDEWFGRVNALPPVLRFDFTVLHFVRVLKITSLNTQDLEIRMAAATEATGSAPPTGLLNLRAHMPLLGTFCVYFTSCGVGGGAGGGGGAAPPAPAPPVPAPEPEDDDSVTVPVRDRVRAAPVGSTLVPRPKKQRC